MTAFGERSDDVRSARSSAGRLSKVPEITALFWVTKALTTAFGESTSDYSVHAIAPAVAVVLGFLAFCVAIYLQFRTNRYRVWAYWLAVSMVGVFGTMAADVLHVGIGVPYAVSTVLFAVVLAAVFVAWHRVEGTLSIHSIRTPRRETFYWAAVVATFALGTAAGDLAATTFGLGYLPAACVFAGLIVVTAIAHLRFRLNAVAAFWIAYVLTRPLGASIADWLGKPKANGGEGVGAGTVAAVLAALIIVSVAYLTLREFRSRGV
jgi:uncharacterized membrane-anchored protein